MYALYLPILEKTIAGTMSLVPTTTIALSNNLVKWSLTSWLMVGWELNEAKSKCGSIYTGYFIVSIVFFFYCLYRVKIEQWNLEYNFTKFQQMEQK